MHVHIYTVRKFDKYLVHVRMHYRMFHMYKDQNIKPVHILAYTLLTVFSPLKHARFNNKYNRKKNYFTPSNTV